MIVKNEEKDIERCLESVIPYIDYWVISDTGSTDNTKEIIQTLMDKHGVPGELHEHEWVDFSTNRNYALELSRPHADFIWFMDADDDFVPLIDDPFYVLSENKHYDCFHMSYKMDDFFFERCAIIRSDARAHYENVLHEVIYSIDKEYTLKAASIPNIGYINARASPLKRNDTEREKYLNDAKILEEDLKKNPLNPRTMFYLAQSYHMAEEFEKAIDYYTMRSQFLKDGNKDEVYVSKLEICKIKIHLNYDDAECIDECISAWELCTGRIDTLVLAMGLLHKRGRNAYAIAIGGMAIASADPTQNKFKLEPGMYDWKFPTMYAYCLYSSGNQESAIEMIAGLINTYSSDPSKKEAIEELEICLNEFNVKKKHQSRAERRKSKKKKK